jgi:outer membrane lipoprotein carrier protein
MGWFWRLLVLGFTCLVSVGVLADPADDLQLRLKPLSSLQGAFEQQVMSTDGEVLENSSGRFMLLRPGYFYWQIEAPDQQLLIAAGEGLWHYDADLETATHRDISKAGEHSPLAILSDTSDNLADTYYVREAGPGRYRLEPRGEDREFLAVTLSFTDAVPVAMEVEDRLQQITRISFGAVEMNGALEPGDFAFEPPPGVDVYYHD